MMNIKLGLEKTWNYADVKPAMLRPLIIAEIGNNHNGDLGIAREMILSAKQAGVDMVKFQTFQMQGLWVGEFLDKDLHIGIYKGKRRKYVEQVQFSSDEWREIAEYSGEIDMPFISTPGDFESVDLLDDIGVKVYKIASMDINNLRFLSHIARKAKPMFVSTGMSTIGEIDRAIETIRAEGNNEIVLLHCTSIYPTPVEMANLHMMGTLRDTFALPTGYSDHTIGVDIPVAATALGACMIEKHMTLDKSIEGQEHFMCADPDDLALLVQKVTALVRAMGSPRIRVLEEEKGLRNFARRSIVTAKPIKRGEIITEDFVAFKRPSTGIAPDRIDDILGRELNKDIDKDTIISWSDLR